MKTLLIVGALAVGTVIVIRQIDVKAKATGSAIGTAVAKAGKGLLDYWTGGSTSSGYTSDEDDTLPPSYTVDPPYYGDESEYMVH